MAKRSKLTSIVCLIVTLLLTVGLLLFAMSALERPSGNQKFSSFFDKDRQFDVLFLGTSAVTYGINPVRLWEKHGITSYNFGINGGTIPESYWSLMMALRHKTPKLVVIDCYSLGMNLKMIESFGHELFDAFPFSPTKLEAARDLTDGDEDKIKEYVFEFLIYHERWKELDEPVSENPQGLKDNSELSMGGVTIKKLQVRGTNDIENDPGNVIEDATVSMDYLERMIRECRQRGIDVLLMYSFVKNDNENLRASNTARLIAGQNDLEYLSFLENGLLNYNIHMGDKENHLNIAGNYRITDYLGSYILEHFEGIESYPESQKAVWDELVRQQRQKDIRAFEEADNAGSAMVIAMDGDYGVYLELDPDSDIYRDDDMRRYFRGLGIDKDRIDKDNRNYVLFDAGGNVTEMGVADDEDAEGDITVAIFDGNGTLLAKRAFSSELVLETTNLEDGV